VAHDETADGAGRSGVATYVVEAVVAAIVLVVGIVVVVESVKLGARWTSDGPGSGYFPFYIGLIISVSSAAIFVQALFGKNKKTAVFVDSVQLKRVMSVLVPATLYVVAIQFLGLYVASAIYIALFMIVLGKYSWLKSVAVALVINALLFFMFETWFKVPLYQGTLEPLSLLTRSR